MPEPTDRVPLCDVGGCENEGTITWGDWVVCGAHLKAHFHDILDLDVYFHILQRKMEGIVDAPIDFNSSQEFIDAFQGD